MRLQIPLPPGSRSLSFVKLPYTLLLWRCAEGMVARGTESWLSRKAFLALHLCFSTQEKLMLVLQHAPPLMPSSRS